MIRNAVVHIHNEQPLLVDLYETPKPADVGLLCTNVRMLDGKRPIFIDRSDSVFYFPYLHIRFVEIPAVSSDLPQIEAPTSEARPEGGPTSEPAEPEADLELDEDFLRRIREV